MKRLILSIIPFAVRILIAITAVAGTGRFASAQSGIDSLPDGARIRITGVTLQGGRYVVSLDSLRRDSLYIGALAPIGRGQIGNLEMSLGREPASSAAWNGAVKGGLIGLGVGFLLVVAAGIEERNHPCNDCMFTPTMVAAAGALATTTVGTLSGLLVGLAQRPEKWVRVQLR